LLDLISQENSKKTAEPLDVAVDFCPNLNTPMINSVSHSGRAQRVSVPLNLKAPLANSFHDITTLNSHCSHNLPFHCLNFIRTLHSLAGNSTPPPNLLTGASDGKGWSSGAISNKWSIVAARRIISPVANLRPVHYKRCQYSKYV
jgi:hypothetical protein